MALKFKLQIMNNLRLNILIMQTKFDKIRLEIKNITMKFHIMNLQCYNSYKVLIRPDFRQKFIKQKWISKQKRHLRSLYLSLKYNINPYMFTF